MRDDNLPALIFHLNKFFITAEQCFLGLLAPFKDGVRTGVNIQPDGTKRIVVTWNQIIDTVGLTISIHYGHHRDVKMVGFRDRDRLLPNIDNKHCIRQSPHVLNASQAAVELATLACEPNDLFLAQLVDAAVLKHGFQVFEPFDGVLHRLVICQCAA